MGKLNNKEICEYLREYRKTNDEQIYEIFVNNFIGQIKYVVSKYNYQAIPYEKIDIENMMKFELYDAMNTYDLNSDVDFSLYVYGKYISRISRLFRTYSAQKRQGGIQYTIESEIGNNGSTFADIISDGINVEAKYIQNHYSIQKLQEIKDLLSDTDFKIYNDYIEGMTYKNIAIKYNIADDKIKSKISYLRKKVRNNINF